MIPYKKQKLSRLTILIGMTQALGMLIACLLVISTTMILLGY